MIVFTENANIANEIIIRGFFVNSQLLKVERYAPHLHIKQCYKCQGFGHKSMQCKRKEKCRRCGKGDHKIDGCEAENSHCANCNGNHDAQSVECEWRTEESKRLHQIRATTSALFPL